MEEEAFFDCKESLEHVVGVMDIYPLNQQLEHQHGRKTVCDDD